jgi:hypothetical protein
VTVLVGHTFFAVSMPDNLRTTLLRSPLVLFVNGEGAVQLFFVLSGFCLASSAARGNLIEREVSVFSMLLEGFRTAGMVPRPYFYKGNWYEATDGMSWRTYLESQPKPARKALQNYARKRRRLEDAGRIRFELVTDAQGLEAGIASYNKVYNSSWKEPEPYPLFAGTLSRSCAAIGCLRLGIRYVDEQPAATELAVVAGSRATMMKTAYDERLSRESVGSIVIMQVMEHLLDVDRVCEIDFGTDDDPYKRIWVSRRRERWGILAFNPRTFRGSVGLIRHLAGEIAGAGRGLVRPIVKPLYSAVQQLVLKDKAGARADELVGRGGE